MPFTPIETRRLNIRLINECDAAELFRYRSLPSVYLYQSWTPKSLEAVIDFAKENFLREPFQPGEYTQLAILSKDDGRLLGDIGILASDDRQQAEIGFTIMPEFQNTGYASEAVEAVLGHLFCDVGMHRVYGSVDPENIPSMHLLEKLGFRKEAHHKRSYRMRGGWYDDVIYAILAEEWVSTARLPSLEQERYSVAEDSPQCPIRIIMLDKAQHKGFKLHYKYVTCSFYDIEGDSDSVFSIRLKERQLPFPIAKSFDGELFEDWLSNPAAFAAVADEAVGFMVLDREGWHNRMRVCELLVLESHRRMGIGSTLIEKAIELARKEGYRELVLETQSCNVNAIRFYFKHGFSVVGIDLSCYTDADVERGEVRLELALRIGA